MRKPILIVLLIFVGCFYTYGQEVKDKPSTSNRKTTIRLSFLAPGLIVDQAITQKTSLQFKIWEGFNYAYLNINGESSSSIEFDTYFTIEPRINTIFSLGIARARSIGHFYGNYIGFPITIGLTESSFSIGPTYGFQRKIGKIGFWNLGLGFGYTKHKGEERFGLLGDFGIGITLN